MGKRIKEKKKVCFIASSGGHLEELRMLKSLMNRYDSYIITEKTTYQTTLETDRVYYIKQINRKEILFILKIMENFLISFTILIKEKPDVVISTGALATIPTALLAKLFRKKLIYVESLAKLSGPSMTGKLLYRFADRFYVQWESLKQFYPNAIYLGGIY